MEDSLYSSSVKVRLAATKILSANPEYKSCPIGLRGAANAILILLGPSFGRADSGVPDLKGGFEDRPIGKYISLGKGIGLYPFGHAGSRATRWRDFLCQCCGELSEIPEYLTGLFNLDWGNEADESKLPIINLKRGADQILPSVEAAKPKVVVALTNRVHDAFKESLVRNNYIFTELPSPLSRPALLAVKTGSDEKWLFVKTQNHPSRSFFSAKDRRIFGEFVRPFLSDT